MPATSSRKKTKKTQSSSSVRTAKRKLEYEDDEDTVDDLKANLHSPTATPIGSSPLKKRTVPKVNVITPPKTENDDDYDDGKYHATSLRAAASAVKEQRYVPTHIYKNLNYIPHDDENNNDNSNVSGITKEVFKLIQRNFIIPDDLERNQAYGPLSGSCYEERVICAYSLDLLPPRKKTKVLVCTHCATLDHRREDCPQLI